METKTKDDKQHSQNCTNSNKQNLKNKRLKTFFELYTYYDQDYRQTIFRTIDRLYSEL